MGAFTLEFLGSIFFLVTITLLIQGGANGFSRLLAGWSATSATFWLPIVYPAAILASIALFLISLTNLVGWGGMTSKMAMNLTWLAAGTLILMTAGTVWVWVVLFGFLLAIIGSALSMDKM